MIVATCRALKMHGGGPDVVAGKPIDPVYKEEALDLVEVRYMYLLSISESLNLKQNSNFRPQNGCSNLLHHIQNIRKFGVTPVVAINR